MLYEVITQNIPAKKRKAKGKKHDVGNTPTNIAKSVFVIPIGILLHRVANNFSPEKPSSQRKNQKPDHEKRLV